MTKTFNSP